MTWINEIFRKGWSLTRLFIILESLDFWAISIETKDTPKIDDYVPSVIFGVLNDIGSAQVYKKTDS